MSLRAATVFLIVASIVACGETDSTSDNTAGPGSSSPRLDGGARGGGGGAGVAGAGGALAPGGGGTSGSTDPPALDGGPITDTHVDAGGDCAPDAGGWSDMVSCCNGVSCRGWCYPADGGDELLCNCGQPPWGVPGGCPDGTLCCGMIGCVAPGFCHEPGH